MSTVEANSVGTHEAETPFSQLLTRVIAGEEIVITRQGTPIARLVPAHSPTTPDNRRAAIQNMREIASRNRLDGLSFKELIAERRP